jgi:signal transduction histidine kinase
LVAVLGRQLASDHEQESQQRLSHGLARHIVGHWPQIAAANLDAADRAAREALLSMLMVVNPGVQVYVLDADGRVSAYIGEAGMVREPQVDLAPVRAFLADAPLPLLGTDPAGSGAQRIFSAAMFPPRAGDVRPPGYLYVVLESQARDSVAAQLGLRRVWQGAGLSAALGLLATLLIGAIAFRQLTRPLNQLAARMRAYNRCGPIAAGAQPPVISVGTTDEVHAIAIAFDGLTQRIEGQAVHEQQQTEAHREMMASVAHDLRTPLTALHGHLEALASAQSPPPGIRDRMLAAALAQSDKVRRLSQQLFELATLQTSGQLLHLERFRLDDLVADAVQKFDLGAGEPPVRLAGTPPGQMDLDGDLQLIERALSNLIDNAMRHAPGCAPVLVSVRREGLLAQILVEDAGPGLPDELLSRLADGRSVRDPPIRRANGGIGGLGLAIAQRIAALHGGSLLPLPGPQGGTRLCLALPLAL